MKAIKSISAALALLAAGPVLAGPAPSDPAPLPEPAMVSSVCSQCHGDKGISTSPVFPNLAAQDKDYLIAQLKAFREHKRGDAHAQAYMWGMAFPLTDDTIGEIAAYYASQSAPTGNKAQDAAQLAQGKAIFEKGIEAETVPACSVCHGETGAGTSAIPRIASQHREYLAAQLIAFRDNSRQNDVMHANVEHMTDDQIRAIAAYLASL